MNCPLICRHGKHIISAGPEVKALLDSYMQLKQRESLALLRALHRPANHFRGIVVLIEYLPISSGSAARETLAEMEERFREAALAEVPQAKIVGVPDVVSGYSLSLDDSTAAHLAVQLVQLGTIVKSL